MKFSHWIFLYSKYHLFSKKINILIVMLIIRRLSISVGLSRKFDFIRRSISHPPPLSNEISFQLFDSLIFRNFTFVFLHFSL